MLFENYIKEERILKNSNIKINLNKKEYQDNLRKYFKKHKKYYKFDRIYTKENFIFLLKEKRIKNEKRKTKNYAYKNVKNKKSFFLTEPKPSEIKYPFNLNIRLIKESI